MVQTEVELMVPSPHSQPCCYDNVEEKRHFICCFYAYTLLSVQAHLSCCDYLHGNWIKGQKDLCSLNIF